MRIELLLPASGRGGQERNHRPMINAILFKRRTGTPWHVLPGRYSAWTTSLGRLRKWTLDGCPYVLVKGRGGHVFIKGAVFERGVDDVPATPGPANDGGVVFFSCARLFWQ